MLLNSSKRSNFADRTISLPLASCYLIQRQQTYYNEMYIYICAFIFSFFSFSDAYANKFDPLVLSQEIALLNDKNEYEQAILMLEDILNNPQSTSYERYNAYLQKALTYKRLYNYSSALKNLDLAIAEPVAAPMREEVDFRVQIERLFIYFDLQKEKEFKRAFSEIDQSKLSLLPADTQSFFGCVLAIMAMRNKDYLEADKELDRAIALQKADNPKNLPSIYRIKVSLYGEMKDHKRVLEAYELGMSYAKKYDIAIYKIIMEESITRYYESIKDYENALYAQKRVSIARTDYDANNQSGKISAIENDLLKARKDLEIKNERNFKYYLISLTVILTLLLFVFWLLYKSNKQRRLLVEKDIERMREVLQKFASEKAASQEPELDLGKFQFTSRQNEIIELVSQGKTNKEIGAALFISENTVKYHLKSIYETLGIDRRADLKRF